MEKETIVFKAIEEKRLQTNLFSIIVMLTHDGDRSFTKSAAEALHEYANGIQNGEYGKNDAESFTSKNDCRIKVIHGTLCPEHGRIVGLEVTEED